MSVRNNPILQENLEFNVSLNSQQSNGKQTNKFTCWYAQEQRMAGAFDVK